MKRGSNLSMFKSEWDATMEKWGRRDLNSGRHRPRVVGCQATLRPLLSAPYHGVS